MKNLVNKIYTKETIARIKKKNKQFGVEHNYDVDLILGNHLIISIFIFIIALIDTTLLKSILIVIAYFFLAEYFFFDYRLAKRRKKLEKQSTFFFQILSLTLESGNNLKNSIDLTCKNMDNELSREFKKAMDDMTLGKSLNESLDDLKTRIPSDTINNIILNLMESNIYGNNMIESLNRELDYISDKIILEAKGKINKMPIKISVVSVLIFIPLLMLIIIGPLIIKVIESLNTVNF
ncbi:type II secretion system F family protein [bacterium]|nr:type II secretion system F family protein [bacterium]MDY3756859.1 type II secretion system F family protein [Bacilli bacterium]